MKLAVLIYILMELGAPHTTAPEIARQIQKASIQYHIDPILITSVIWHESRFRTSAYRKSTSDYGLMQIHCPTRDYAPWCKQRKKFATIKCNINIGVYLLYIKKKRCLRDHKHKSHWIRHNNWLDKNYDTKILRTSQIIRRMIKNYENNRRNL